MKSIKHLAKMSSHICFTVHGVIVEGDVSELCSKAKNSVEEICGSLACYNGSEDRRNISKHIRILRDDYQISVLIDGEEWTF
jgi:DNA-binding transcriptional ArsR family regulator